LSIKYYSAIAKAEDLNFKKGIINIVSFKKNYLRYTGPNILKIPFIDKVGKELLK